MKKETTMKYKKAAYVIKQFKIHRNLQSSNNCSKKCMIQIVSLVCEWWTCRYEINLAVLEVIINTTGTYKNVYWVQGLIYYKWRGVLQAYLFYRRFKYIKHTLLAVEFCLMRGHQIQAVPHTITPWMREYLATHWFAHLPLSGGPLRP